MRVRPIRLTDLSEEDLEALIEEATVDCYDPYEQEAGFCAILEDKLGIPFTTTLFGVKVTVKKLEQHDEDIHAICVHGHEEQAIPLTQLPISSPPPNGIAWLDAYRHFRRFS
jgi:hypothetical protein